MEYLVSWKIDIDADSPTEAAARAQEILLDPENTAWCFDVEWTVKMYGRESLPVKHKILVDLSPDLEDVVEEE